MIIEKTFNVGHKTKGLLKAGAVMAALYITALVSTRLDLDGFQRYVPNASQVTGVYITTYVRWETLSPDGDSDWITDPGVIADVIEAHRNAVAEMGLLREKLSFAQVPGSIDRYILQPQAINYRMADGSTVSRMYYLPVEKAVRDGWLELHDDERVILSDFQPLLKREIISANVFTTEYDPDNAINGEETVMITDPAELASLMEAVKRDLIDTRRVVNALIYIPGYQNLAQAARLEFMLKGGLPQNRYQARTYGESFPYHVYLNSGVNTLRWLEENRK
jgi:hypothetical protein